MVNDRPTVLRCAIYTRKSSDEGLEQSFNSLDAQREACEAYILSQRHEGWQALPNRYDDGGFSGGSMNRPALQSLMQDIEDGNVDLIVVYKVDRLTRSLSDFAKMVELFDSKKISFVSVTQQFNTTTSMGRLTLNVLLSFAQFEREVTGERIRDKIAASKRKGMWMGGRVPVGYDAVDRQLVINPTEAEHVLHIYQRYLALGCVSALKVELDDQQIFSKVRTSRSGKQSGGKPYSRGALYELLKNRVYIGETSHREQHYPGAHEAIIQTGLWENVQAKLAANVQGQRAGIKAKEPSLLTGLVVDNLGRRLTPSHAVKGEKRYRYYVSLPDKCGRHSPSAPPIRVPAKELEGMVVNQIHEFLLDAKALLDAFADKDWDAQRQHNLIQAAKDHVDRWWTLLPTIQRDFLQKAIQKIEASDGTIRLSLDRESLLDAIAPATNGMSARPPDESLAPLRAPIIELTIAAKLARCGLEVRLVVPGDFAKETSGKVSQSLIKAIARGRNWYERLTAGEGITLTELANESGVNNRYASRILRFAFLAPDLVDAILDGRQPKEMTLEKALTDLPNSWSLQRHTFNLQMGSYSDN